MARSLALLAALAGAAVAADSTTTVPVLLPWFDKQEFVGSIVDADSKITTIAIACAPNVAPDECGYPGTFTVQQGASTWSLSLGLSASFETDVAAATQDASCKLDPDNDVASCVASVTQNVSNSEMRTTTSEVLTGYKTYMIPVTVTAGVDKLSAAPGASETGSQATPTATGANTLSTAASATSSGSKTGSNASATSSPTSTNAAGPMVTQNAVLAGVAAVVGGALMM
ncbi:Mitogen-activated protein kinase HOG1 [Purpureocillium lavendulum]|uniref:Mitogen-activated protein kinase HOG1 n=1 Tax=Purpureocillium lavendulum TaxID=1247861 RepID=A0AB34G0A2_9HYPO|nr:Mitogen-activated protein kinase HOG1 [Purpureocillium lavendulum]